MDIFERLLLPFRGLFFASPAIIPDGGGGDAGDAGGDGGTGGGDEGVADDSVGDGSDDGSGDGGTGDDQTDTGDEEGLQEGDEEQADETEGEPDKAKGAKPTVESALNKLRKVDPKSADVLRREHFQNVQYRMAGTPQEVQTMKDFMTLHGGEEEISTKIEQGDRFATELDMVARGDRQIVKDIAGDSPEGLMKLAPAVLDECQRIDPKRFGVMMAGPMARIFRETGVTPLMQQVQRFIKAGQQKEGFEAMQELLNWVGQVEQLAEQSQEQPITDRERKLQEQERGIQSEKTKIYQGEVGKVSVARTNSAISRHLTPLINDAKKKGIVLTLEQKQDVASGVYTEIANSLKANNTYQRQMKAFYQRQAPPEEIAEYVEGHVQRLAEKASKAVWERKGWAARMGRNGAKPGAAGGGNGQRPPAVMLSKQPAPENVDWSKDPTRAKFIGDGRVGEATLNDGKVVRWRWN